MADSFRSSGPCPPVSSGQSWKSRNCTSLFTLDCYGLVRILTRRCSWIQFNRLFIYLFVNCSAIQSVIEKRILKGLWPSASSKVTLSYNCVMSNSPWKSPSLWLYMEILGSPHPSPPPPPPTLLRLYEHTGDR